MEGNSKSKEKEDPEIHKLRNLRGFLEPPTHKRTPVGFSEPIGKENPTGIHPTQIYKMKETQQPQKIKSTSTISNIGKQFACNITLTDLK